MPTGGKLWRFKYRIDGREKQLSLSVFDDVGVKEAYERRDDNRKLLAAAIDPSVKRKAVKLARVEGANNFEVIAREWIEKQSLRWEPSNKSKVIRRLDKDVFPWLGRVDI